MITQSATTGVTGRTVKAEVERGRGLGDWIVKFESEAVPGTLAIFAGVLTLARLDITSAIVRKSGDGKVHDEFEVTPADGRILDASEGWTLAAAASRAMAGTLDLHGRLAAARAAHAPTASSWTTVEMMEDSELSTGIRVRTPDRPGLLHDIAFVLTKHGMRTRAITVITFGGEARDTFRIVDTYGDAPRGARLVALREELLRVCS